MPKEKKTRVVKIVLSLTLTFALLIACIYGLLTASDSKVNVFTLGKVKIELNETLWNDDTWTYNSLTKTNTFTFGEYPQTNITDTDTVEALETAAADVDWISYGYYINGTSSDYMQYKDVEYNGEKYRAVTFSKYRPYLTSSESTYSRSDDEYTNSAQDNNEYYAGNTYWFKWEPITWSVVDPDQGYVVPNLILDSQAYNDSGDAAAFENTTIYAFLQNFYDEAFTDEEKLRIQKFTDDDDYYVGLVPDYYNKSMIYTPGDTSSSIKDMLGLSSFSATDYANIQGYNNYQNTYTDGLYITDTNSETSAITGGNRMGPVWSYDEANDTSETAYIMQWQTVSGKVYKAYNTHTDVGVIPMMRISKFYNDIDNNGVYDFADSLVANQCLWKDPNVTNTGSNDCWVICTVAIPTVTTAQLTNIQQYFSKQGSNKLQIPIKAYGLQDGSYDTHGQQAIWDLYVSKTGFDYDGDEYAKAKDTSDRIELFTFCTGTQNTDGTRVTDFTETGVNTHNGDWVQYGDVYMSSNGYNYYTFFYVPTGGTGDADNLVNGGMLAPEEITEPIFDFVVLNENIK